VKVDIEGPAFGNHDLLITLKYPAVTLEGAAWWCRRFATAADRADLRPNWHKGMAIAEADASSWPGLIICFNLAQNPIGQCIGD
jgi:hypothetical protein